MLGRRHPRERLVEQDLCTAFDTHRGDVRLALFELEKMGIVERIPNRGAIVRDSQKPSRLLDVILCGALHAVFFAINQHACTLVGAIATMS